MAASINWGSFSWVSFQQEPYYFGSIVGPLMDRNCQRAQDYVESMGDSLDLHLGLEACGCDLVSGFQENMPVAATVLRPVDTVLRIPIGGWRGSGRKSRWVSPWLLATPRACNFAVYAEL